MGVKKLIGLALELLRLVEKDRVGPRTAQVKCKTDPVADRTTQVGSKLLRSHEVLIPTSLNFRSEPKQFQDIQSPILQIN